MQITTTAYNEDENPRIETFICCGDEIRVCSIMFNGNHHYMYTKETIKGLVHQLKTTEEENKQLKELLLKVGATTHKCKELHDWYCENNKEQKGK